MHTTKTSASKHIPRRSGVGARQVIAPRRPKVKRQKLAQSAPPVCGVEHPEHADLFCTGRIRFVKGERIQHLGAHRARPLQGVRFRWDDVEAAA